MINTSAGAIAAIAGAVNSGASGFAQIATSTLGDADSFSKVWGVLIAALTVIAAAAISSLATAVVQFINAYQQKT